MTCPICQRITLARAGREPALITSLRESLVVLHDHQSYEGWCVVWLKDHAEHMYTLSVERQTRLWEDVAEVAAAVNRAFAPARLNYECLGNVVGHIHWHIIPRYEAGRDPEPRATVWVRPAAERECGVSDSRRADLVKRLRTAGGWRDHAVF